MPKIKRRFLQMKPPAVPTPKQQCCVVCYAEFTPFTTTSDRWESSMIKMFYNVLDIPSMGASGEDGDGDEDDSVISLPFCPQCHSKVAIMSSLRTQLEQIQTQFSTVRDDIAFTIVGTINRNCRNGPMDFIRQQIYNKWKVRFEDARARGDLDNKPRGLERLASSLPSGALPLEDLKPFRNYPPRAASTPNPRQLALPAPPGPGTSSSSSVSISNRSISMANGMSISPPTSATARSMMQQIHSQRMEDQLQQQQESSQTGPGGKRPPRAASLGYAQYLLYSQTTSRAQIKKMEAMAIQESINHEMPKLTPMDGFHHQLMRPSSPQKAKPGHGPGDILLPIKPKGKPGPMSKVQKAAAAAAASANASPSTSSASVAAPMTVATPTTENSKISRPRQKPGMKAMTNTRGARQNQSQNDNLSLPLEPQPVKRRNSAGKRTNSSLIESAPAVPAKLPKVQTAKSILKGLKNEEPVKIKLKNNRKQKYQPDPPLSNNSTMNVLMNDTSIPAQSPQASGSGNDLLSKEPESANGKAPVVKGRRITDSTMNGDFPCGLCPKMYNNISRLRRHESLCHPSTKSLQCTVCPKGFSSMLAYRRHMQNQHQRSLAGNVTITCPFCKKSFVKQAAYDYHIKKHHDKKVKQVRSRRTKAEMMSLKLQFQQQQEEQEPSIAMAIAPGPQDEMEVDPLLITTDDTDMAGEGEQPDRMEVEEYEEEEEEPIQNPRGRGRRINTNDNTKKPKKKPNKIFGKKSKKRRAAGKAVQARRAAAAAAAAAAPKTQYTDEESLKSAEETPSVSNIKAEPSTSIQRPTTRGPPRKVTASAPAKLGPPPAPARKSLRTRVTIESDSNAHIVKGEITIDHHDLPPIAGDEVDLPFDDDKVVYHCSTCTATFAQIDELNLHTIEEHPPDLEPEPIEINLEEPEPLQQNIPIIISFIDNNTAQGQGQGLKNPNSNYTATVSQPSLMNENQNGMDINNSNDVLITPDISSPVKKDNNVSSAEKSMAMAPGKIMSSVNNVPTPNGKSPGTDMGTTAGNPNQTMTAPRDLGLKPNPVTVTKVTQPPPESPPHPPPVSVSVVT